MGQRTQLYWLAGILGTLFTAGGAATWLVLRAPSPVVVSPPPARSAPSPVPAPQPQSTPRPSVSPSASPALIPYDLGLRTASVDTINARREPTDALFRLDVDPAILVLDFASLHRQALMLNRVAALIEKADMPRDRVVGEVELDDHIRATSGDPDRYYGGHDYRAADLARFSRLAAAEGQPLNAEEAWLRSLLDGNGWLRPGAIGALISIPGVEAGVDPAARTTILRHELSHAVYFIDPAYVALTHHLWNDMLTAEERDAIRRFLGQQGYDTRDDDLMANEAQAHLIHTRDPRFCNPAMLGLSEARAAALRAAFIDAIPEPWLKASALAAARDALLSR